MMSVFLRRWGARVLFLLLLAAKLWSGAAAASFGSAASIEPNDNRRASGTLDGGTLSIALRAGQGRWQPEGTNGPTLETEAFGELGKALTVPAPLIRVTEGTEIVVSVRNDLRTALVVNGLCTRDGTPCRPLAVPANQTREVRFRSGPAGTYHYGASTLNAPVPFREMAGALVVDPSGRPAEPDRILVITEWTNLTPGQIGKIFSADVSRIRR